MCLKNKIFILVIFLSCFFILTKAADAATYYVATNGSDGNSCSTAQSIATPKRTINNGVSCLTPGSILYIRAGTYGESLEGNISSGTSWSSPVTVSAYPGETVTLNPSGGRVGYFSGKRYIVIDGFIMDGVNISGDVIKIDGGSDHIRIKNSELKNAYCKGVDLGSNSGCQGILAVASPYNEYINLKIHDLGINDFQHGIYMSGGSDYSLIENSEFYNIGGHGIHLFGRPHNNIIRGNKAHDNGKKGRGPGIGIYGYDNLVYNNISWNNTIGITMDCSDHLCDNNKIYNNTVYSNGVGILIGNDSVILKNNIVYQGGISGAGQSIQSNNLTTNPQFVNAAAGNFRLQPISPAINAGVTLSEVTTDITGATRPVGGAYDIGAYEYGGTAGPTSTPTATVTPTPSPTGELKGDLNNDRIVNSLDWSLMNARWFTNDSLADLNSDGIVNSLDFSIMNGNWLRSG